MIAAFQAQGTGEVFHLMQPPCATMADVQGRFHYGGSRIISQCYRDV